MAALSLFASVGVGAGSALAGSSVPTPPTPAAGCDYAAHSGIGGAQFKKMTPQAQYAAIVLCNDGVMTGTAANLFSPYLSVTRAQAVKFVVKALGVPLSGSQTPAFKDVSPNSPYYLYVQTAEALGILPFATAGGDFSPGQAIARDEFAAMVVDALGQQAAAAKLATTATKFSDDAQIPSQYRGDVNEALALGIVEPYTATRYNPTGNLQRSGMALGLLRLIYQLYLASPASVSLSSAMPDVGVGQADIITPTFKSAGGTTIAAGALGSQFQTSWSVSPTTGAQVAANADGTATFVGSAAGTYTVTETISGGGLSSPVTGTAKVAVYGPATQLAVSVPSTIVGDGVTTATATVTAEDANGNTVADFSGDITLTDTSNGAVEFETSTGPSPTAQLAAATNGVATFNLVSQPNAGRTDTLTATATGLTNGTAQISTTAPVATSISLTPASKTVSVDSVSPDTVTAEVLDQAGNPMPVGAYTVTFNVSGAGTFSGGSTTSQTGVYVGEGTAAPFLATAQVYSEQGVTGTITVTASATGLTSGTTTINAVLTGAPHALQVSSTTGTAGTSGSSAGSVTVTVVDQNGVPVNVSSADQVTVTFTAGNPNGTAVGEETLTGTIPAGSDSVTISTGTSDTVAGTYAFTATDALGLTAASGKLTLTAGQAALVALSPATPGTLSTCTAGTGGTCPTVEYVNASTSPVTFSAQVEDTYGNAVADSGVTVSFTLTPASNTGTATITGSTSATTTAGTTTPVDVTATTNANGVATVTFQGQDVPGDTYTLKAAATGIAGSSLTTIYMEYASASNISVTTSTPNIAANPGVTATIDISVLGPGNVIVPSGDILTATASGGDLESATADGGTYRATDNTVTFPWAPGATLTFAGGAEGSTTIKVVDDSSATGVSGSTTIFTTPGSPFQVVANGGSPYVNGRYSVTAPGVYGPFTLNVADFGGNAVADQAPITLTETQVNAILGSTGISGIRTSAGGTDVSTITIPAGTTAFQVWAEVDTASTGTPVTFALPTAPSSTTELSRLDPIASVTLANGGTAGTMDKGDSVAITFTMPIDGTAINSNLTDGASGVSISGGSNATGTITDDATNTVTVSNIVTLSGFTESGTADSTGLATTAALSGNGQTLTITLAAGPQATVTQPSTATINATYVSSPGVKDANGDAIASSSTTPAASTPTVSGSF